MGVKDGYERYAGRKGLKKGSNIGLFIDFLKKGFSQLQTDPISARSIGGKIRSGHLNKIKQIGKSRDRIYIVGTKYLQLCFFFENRILKSEKILSIFGESLTGMMEKK